MEYGLGKHLTHEHYQSLRIGHHTRQADTLLRYYLFYPYRVTLLGVPDANVMSFYETFLTWLTFFLTYETYETFYETFYETLY